MSVLSKGTTFANNDQVTSTKLNQLVDQATFTANAVDGITTQLTTGKIAVKEVNTGQIASNAVTTSKIADSNVTTAKIADSNVTTAKIADSNVTTAKIADSNVTTAKIPDSAITTAKVDNAAITAEKLSGAQSGSAPIFGVRAAAEFTLTNPRTIRHAYNIATVTRASNNESEVTFTTAMPNADYIVVCGNAPGATGNSRNSPSLAYDKTTAGFKLNEAADGSSNGTCFYVIG